MATAKNPALGPPRIGLIGLDLDGTLLNSQKQITPRVRRALSRAASAGIVVLPATGRSVAGIPVAVLQATQCRYAITCNGAEIQDLADETVLFSDYFNTETFLSVLADCRALGLAVSVMANGFMYTDWRDFTRLDGTFTPHQMEYFRTSRQMVDNLAVFIPQSGYPVAKFSLQFPSLSVRPRALRQLASRADTTVTASLDTNLEVNTATASKGSALLWLAAHLGLARGAVMAAGDGSNDLDMIEKAGFGVAMANSTPEVLAKADYIAPSCDEDGIAVVIEGLLDGTIVPSEKRSDTK